MNSLVPVDNMYKMATALVQSGMLPREVNSPQKAFAIMTMGREIGVGPWTAINGIHVIQGKPTISPQLMLALINRSGELEDMQIKSDAQRCEVKMKRRDRSTHTETFTIKDAETMGLAIKQNWQKQPAVMLKWRAISACARIVFPDVIMGFYTHEELDPDLQVDPTTGEIVADAYDYPDYDTPETTQVPRDEYSPPVGNPGTPRLAGTVTPRPYDPDTLYEMLQRSCAAKTNHSPASKEQRGLLAAMLGKALGEGSTDKDRYLVTAFLREDGAQSTTAFTFGEAQTWLNWLVDQETKELDPVAGEEARRALHEARIAAGQLDMFEGDYELSDDMDLSHGK